MRKVNSSALTLDGTNDPLTNAILALFEKKDIVSEGEVKISGGEIDVIAFFMGAILLIECKHTLLPTSVHESRTTYDYIRKAEKQLDKAIDAYNSGSILPQIQQRLGIKAADVREIIPMIIVSNRIFSGNLFKYPVRNVHEFINQIDTGELKTNDGTFCLWQGTNFTLADLKAYLHSESPIFKLFKESVTQYEVTYDFFSPPIRRKDYYLDIEAGKEKLSAFTKKHRKVGG